MRPRFSDLLSIDTFYRRLANVEALPQLVILAIGVGLFTGAVIICFRLCIDWPLRYLLSGHPHRFEALAMEPRVALTLGGAVVIGLMMQWLSPADRRVGVLHVMERLSLHQGHLPLRNAVLQFTGVIIALISGQSGGREGPAVHLGAATASGIGHVFRLPNNSRRTLLACGVAAAVASSFNTPIAGVIFAMEVVMMEYSIASFLPVIVAAVTSTFLTQYVFGDQPAFEVTRADLASLAELPFIVLVGVVTGCVAAAFIYLVQWFASLRHWAFFTRALAAGSLTAGAGIVAPEVLGIGYDTVNGAMAGSFAVATLLVIAVLKTVCSAASVGLGMPVGLIGPTFVIGAALGGAFGIMGQQFGDGSTVALYVMLGMAAMMAAVLQAPLAALMAVMEMTANPRIIPPAMLIIVVATLMVSQVFRLKSVFLGTLNTLGLDYPPSPVKLHLQRAGVMAIMERRFVRTAPQVTRSEARRLLENKPRWVVLEDTENVHCILNAADLAAFLETQPERSDTINLLRIPGQRFDVVAIDARATVQEAQQAIAESSAEACLVRRLTAPMIRPVVGIITEEEINGYRSEID
ncbi:MAG: chloride channel protein [Pseudomonadales bacterium]|nr:chloride channel protein [Pseudomonadales bacterium]